MKKSVAEIIKTNPTFVGRAGTNTPPLTRLFTGATRTEKGCLIPLKKPASGGYVQTRIDGVLVAAHRYVYKQLVGGLRRGQVVMHSCDVPACIEPTHLNAGTQSENMQDCSAKGRHSTGYEKALTEPEIRTIYTYPAPVHVTAEKLGYPVYVVQRVRSHRSYRPITRKLQAQGLRVPKFAPGRTPR